MLLCGLAIALAYRKCRKNNKREEDYRDNTDTNTSNLGFGTTDGLDLSDIKRLQKLKGKWGDSDSEDLPAKELDPAARRKIQKDLLQSMREQKEDSQVDFEGKMDVDVLQKI